MIITIDGPVATGKSTIARRLAEEIGFIYFDTGAMFRCLSYGILKHRVSLQNSSELLKFLNHFDFDVKIYYSERRYYVDKEDVTDNIRNQEVTDFVSEVSAIQAVREKLVIV